MGGYGCGEVILQIQERVYDSEAGSDGTKAKQKLSRKAEGSLGKIYLVDLQRASRRYPEGSVFQLGPKKLKSP